jgi:VIT1/CCC1 family predicted Fe2+/Mn2+ transporter
MAGVLQTSFALSALSLAASAFSRSKDSSSSIFKKAAWAQSSGYYVVATVSMKLPSLLSPVSLPDITKP